jgi:hypothetical protein
MHGTLYLAPRHGMKIPFAAVAIFWQIQANCVKKIRPPP